MRHLWVLVFVLACTDEGDGGPGPGPGPSVNPCIDRATPAMAHTHLDGGGTYAGKSCIESMCHRAGALGPQAKAYLVAGTVYKTDLTTPQAGATIRIYSTDSNNITKVVTDTAGNFLLASGGANPLPARVDVTACPTTQKMLESIPNPDYANCSENSCHATTGPGPGPITLAD